MKESRSFPHHHPTCFPPHPPPKITSSSSRTTPRYSHANLPISPNHLTTGCAKETLTRFYGPDTTGQIDPRFISSFTFTQLEDYLNFPAPLPTPTPTNDESEVTPAPVNPVRQALQNADWIIFAMLNPNANPPQSNAVRRFLSEKKGTPIASSQPRRYSLRSAVLSGCHRSEQVERLPGHLHSYHTVHRGIRSSAIR